MTEKLWSFPHNEQEHSQTLISLLECEQSDIGVFAKARANKSHCTTSMLI